MEIPAKVMKEAREKAYANGVTWLCYVEQYRGDILLRTFGAKRTKKSGFWILEVMREIPGCDTIMQRLLYWTGMGWHIDYEDAEIDPDSWWRSVSVKNRPNIWFTLINPEAVTECERYKYSGWRPSLPIIDYLALYKQNPGIEYFGRLGLVPRKSLINKATKDGSFRKWLRTLSAEQIKDANGYGASATLAAYKEKAGIRETHEKQAKHRRLHREMATYAKPIIKRYTAERIREYLGRYDGRRYAIFNDYLRACEYLGLDFNDTKIAFPKDLEAMHNMRTQEAAAKREREDREKNKAMIERFITAAKELLRFEASGAAFAIIIPRHPDELKAEGKALHHCVGRMFYDRKMANGESFIAFCRSAADPAKPLVTIEYDLKFRRVRQCYADHNSAPDPEIMAFVHGWERNVTGRLEKETKEEKTKGAA